MVSVKASTSLARLFLQNIMENGNLAPEIRRFITSEVSTFQEFVCNWSQMVKVTCECSEVLFTAGEHSSIRNAPRQ